MQVTLLVLSTQGTGDFQWDFEQGQHYSHNTNANSATVGLGGVHQWEAVFITDVRYRLGLHISFCHAISSYPVVPSHGLCIQGTKVLQ